MNSLIRTYVPARRTSRRKRLLFIGAAVLSCIVSSTAAFADDRWQAHGVDAVAVLPDAEPGAPFSQARLSCAEQKWSFSITAVPDGAIDGLSGALTIAVDGREFGSEAIRAEDNTITAPVARELVEPLKRGNRLAISLDATEKVARYSLRGSRRAITLAEERCSPRALPIANRVLMTPYTSYLPLARTLRADDMKAFELATSSRPTLQAGMLEIDGDRRILFTELCGSSWYFGVSGCNVSGYAPSGEAGDGWQLVLDMEGAAVYADPAVGSEGWPDIVALPIRTEGDGTTWRWNGSAYAISPRGEAQAGMAPAE